MSVALAPDEVERFIFEEIPHVTSGVGAGAGGVRDESSSFEAADRGNFESTVLRGTEYSSAMAIIKTQKVRSISSSILAPNAFASLKNSSNHSG